MEESWKYYEDRLSWLERQCRIMYGIIIINIINIIIFFFIAIL